MNRSRPRPTDRAARAARYAVSVIFFLTGVGSANWAVRIPAVQDRLGLTEGKLGFALLGLSAGAIVAMAIAGRLVAKHGSRPVTAIAVLAFAAALALPPLAPTATMLMLALVALGMANGLLDVAMNAQAAAVQKQYERPIMSRVHALYSVGGLVGAATGGRAAAHGIGATPHLIVVGLVIAIVATAVVPRLLSAATDAAPGRRSIGRPSRGLLVLGVVAFCVLFGEGAMANWSTVYLRDVTLAGPGLAAVGFASFSLMMAAGRAVGDTLAARFGSVQVTRFGGIVASLGAICALAFPHPLPVILGFGAIGAGLSSIFPIVLGASARIPGVVPGAAIALVSMCGYGGLLAGPPLIGTVATAFTLRGGLALVAVTSVLVVVLARVVASPSRAHLPRIRASSAEPADQRERVAAA
jgi:MFS family permease